MTGFHPGFAGHPVAGRNAVPGWSSGFSLLEMMVALAVAGILFFVALPGYQTAVIKSGRAAARAGLLEVAARQEQFFVNRKQYAVGLESLGLGEPYYIDSQGEAVARAAAVYRLTLVIADGSYLGAMASPVNRQREDTACATFSLSRTGIKAVTGDLSASPADCW